MEIKMYKLEARLEMTVITKWEMYIEIEQDHLDH